MYFLEGHLGKPGVGGWGGGTDDSGKSLGFAASGPHPVTSKPLSLG